MRGLTRERRRASRLTAGGAADKRRYARYPSSYAANVDARHKQVRGKTMPLMPSAA